MPPPSPSADARCPFCRKPAAAEHAPFCSRGCKDRDLLKWLGDGYAIPGERIDDETLDNADQPD